MIDFEVTEQLYPDPADAPADAEPLRRAARRSFAGRAGGREVDADRHAPLRVDCVCRRRGDGRVRVGHTRNKGEIPSDGFMREIVLEGELTGEQRSRLIEIAERCPVHTSLMQGARVSTQEVNRMVPSPGTEDASQHAHDMTTE